MEESTRREVLRIECNGTDRPPVLAAVGQDPLRCALLRRTQRDGRSRRHPRGLGPRHRDVERDVARGVDRPIGGYQHAQRLLSATDAEPYDLEAGLVGGHFLGRAEEIELRPATTFEARHDEADDREPTRDGS